MLLLQSTQYHLLLFILSNDLVLDVSLTGGVVFIVSVPMLVESPVDIFAEVESVLEEVPAPSPHDAVKNATAATKIKCFIVSILVFFFKIPALC